MAALDAPMTLTSRPLVAVVALCVTWLGVAVAQVCAVEVSPKEIQNRRCLQCHGQSRMATLPPSERAAMVAPGTQPATRPTRPGIHVTPESLSGSVHANLSCVDCHADAVKLPHAQRLAAVSCSAICHTKPVSDFTQGAHAVALAKNDPRAPSCITCHGAHEILKADDRASKTHPLNVIKTCGECHEKFARSPNGHSGNQLVSNYLDSVHGQAVAKGGLAVAATCAGCHGPHKVLPAKDVASSVNRANLAQTCGRCHTGVTETFAASVHGQLIARGAKEPPSCADCHTSHAITRTDTPAFKLDIVNECGTCHDKPRPAKDGGGTTHASLYETYRRSYHGQVTALGYMRGARCSDCHGAHDVKRIDDPASRMYASNRVETCGKCHGNATASFVKFEAHADHRDAGRYPVLYGVWIYFVIVMSSAFGFFGLHSVLWFFRSMVERVRRGPLPKHNGNHGAKAIQRFNKVDRINHAFVIVSFFGLTITGLPLLYSDKGWATTLMSMLGGVRMAGVLHRVFAVMLIGNFVVHGFGIANRIRKHGFKKLVWGPYTMLPQPKDFRDCLGMWKWFFVGGKKPKFDRWTYWEKFDYVAEVGGSGIIAFSGLLLWFPEFFAKFVPGWMFNVATIVHGYEAVLAIGFIFTIHFFNAHLRLEKFPVDDVMFTGRLPEEEFAHEREAEYERLDASGEIEKLRVAPPPKWYRPMAVAAGLLAMAIGTTLVVLIILAGLNLM
jgi:cytochrome b subunit of formate dehydrogenase